MILERQVRFHKILITLAEEGVYQVKTIDSRYGKGGGAATWSIEKFGREPIEKKIRDVDAHNSAENTSDFLVKLGISPTLGELEEIEDSSEILPAKISTKHNI